MKTSGRYILRELGGRGVLTPASVRDGSAGTRSGALRAITLSGSAYWLLKSFEGRDFTLDEAVDAVCGRYDVPRETALSDITSLLDTLRRCGALTD